MKKTELVYREILYQVVEKKILVFTQLELSRRLGLSLSVIHKAVQKLREMGAVRVLQRSFKVVDMRKILYYWASIRNLERDVFLRGRVDMEVREIERIMSHGVVFTAYSAYKFRFHDVPADYSEVYVYADALEDREIQKRFFFQKKSRGNSIRRGGRLNLFVLKKDDRMHLYPSLPLSQIFADLWNLGEWYAQEFVHALEGRIF